MQIANKTLKNIASCNWKMPSKLFCSLPAPTVHAPKNASRMGVTGIGASVRVTLEDAS